MFQTGANSIGPRASETAQLSIADCAELLLEQTVSRGILKQPVPPTRPSNWVRASQKLRSYTDPRNALAFLSIKLE